LSELNKDYFNFKLHCQKNNLYGFYLFVPNQDNKTFKRVIAWRTYKRKDFTGGYSICYSHKKLENIRMVEYKTLRCLNDIPNSTISYKVIDAFGIPQITYFELIRNLANDCKLNEEYGVFLCLYKFHYSNIHKISFKNELKEFNCLGIDRNKTVIVKGTKEYMQRVATKLYDSWFNDKNFFNFVIFFNNKGAECFFAPLNLRGRI
jgi:hypothetical protein